MTSISYEDIFAYFLGGVSDYDIAKMKYSDAYPLMEEYLHKTIANAHVRSLFSTVNFNDDEGTLSYELDHVLDDSTDKYFVMNLLGNAMVIEWLNPRVRDLSLINQMVGSDKSRTFYSQANHLNELRSLLESTTISLDKMITDRNAFYNSYLGD